MRHISIKNTDMIPIIKGKIDKQALAIGIKPKGGGLDFLAILTLRSVNLRHSFMHRAFLECLLCASQWGFTARMGSETQTI